PHGSIKEIRFKDGIPWNEFTVVLPQDIPGKNIVTLIEPDQPFLADREIRHIAEPVALIAHTDRDLLERALRHIEIEVDELSANFDMEEALRRDQIFKKYVVQNGDPSLALPSADVMIEETYRTGSQEHLYIETQAMIATAVPGDQVTVWGSMQCP